MRTDDFISQARSQGWPKRFPHLLIACSGGADSMALLHLLRLSSDALGLHLRVVHVHHGIRGAEADGDASFVEAACARWRLPFGCVHVDVPAFAQASGRSLEEAARHLRLNVFEEQLAETGASVVVTGHHLDDQAETLWFKVMQGVSPAGLRGMMLYSEIGLVRMLRPLLNYRAEELRDFLSAHGLDWREDRMNRDPIHLRSRIRMQLMPLLEEMNPQASRHAARLARIAAEEEEWISGIVKEALCKARTLEGLDGETLRGMYPALRRRVLRQWCEEEGVSFRAVGSKGLEWVENLILREGGAYRFRDILLRYECGQLIRVKPTVEWAEQELPVPGVMNCGTKCLHAMPDTGWDVPKGAEAWLSQTRLHGKSLRARAWQEGDRYRPFGAPGSRKLKDLFSDARIPQSQRRELPVVECEGEIIWVPGFRIAEKWAVEGLDFPSIHLKYD